LTKKYRLYAACRYFMRYGTVKDPKKVEKNGRKEKE
jgi:hypothetical protein